RADDARRVDESTDEPEGCESGVAHEYPCSADEPRPGVRPDEEVEEPGWLLEIENEQCRGERREGESDACRHEVDRDALASLAQEDEKSGGDESAGADRLRHEVRRDHPLPRHR